MAAPKGNKFALGNSGKPKYIESPERLWELFLEYEQFTKNKPFLIKDWVGKDANEVLREKEKPLSKAGFYAFVRRKDIMASLKDYFNNSNNQYNEFSNVTSAITEIMEGDQMEGGMANVYNQNIIARLLGLVDKSDITSNGDKINSGLTLKIGDKEITL